MIYTKKYTGVNISKESNNKYLKEYTSPTAEYLLKSNFLSEFKTLAEKDLAKLSLNIKDGKSAYEEALSKGLVSNYNEWLLLIKGDKGNKGDKGDAGTFNSVSASIDPYHGIPSVDVSYDGENVDFFFKNLKGDQGDKGDKGDKGDDGTVSFDSLNDKLKADLVTKSIVDTQFDANSINPISNSAMYIAFSDMLLKYLDLLNMNIALSNIITNMQELMLHLGISVLMTTDDEYDILEKNNLINPEALYLTTDETSAVIKDLSGSWVFGGTFPIYFGTELEKSESSFVFDGTFPIQFGTEEKSNNEFDLEFTITFK